MSGLVIAGISGAGKTTLHRKVAAALAADEREIIAAFPQAMTTTAHLQLADRPLAQAAAVLGWCQRVVAFWEDVERRALMLRAEPYARNWVPALLLEGFIFDIPLHEFAIEREEVLPLEQRLAALGVQLAVLQVSAQSIQRQCVQSTRRTRGQGWYEHLQAFGATDEERAAHFLQQQSLLLEWARTSPLRSTVIDTDDGNWDAHAAELFSFIG